MADLVALKEADKVMDKSARPLSMELCCGHAGLSAALQGMGWDTRPVDWAGNRHKTSTPVLQRDLTDSEEVAKIIKLLKQVSYLHFAPPLRDGEYCSRKALQNRIGETMPQTPQVRSMADGLLGSHMV